MHGNSLGVLKSEQTNMEHRGEGTCSGSEHRLEGSSGNELRSPWHHMFLLRVQLDRAALGRLHTVYLFGLLTADLSFDFV